MRLQSADIREHYDRIRDALDEVRRITAETWRPEDVYAACVNAQAFFYVADDGFVVVKPLRDAYSGEQYLHVWIAWGDGVDLVERYKSEVDKLAAVAGCNRIELVSPRRGWERVAGWSVKSVTYERRL